MSRSPERVLTESGRRPRARRHNREGPLGRHLAHLRLFHMALGAAGLVLMAGLAVDVLAQNLFETLPTVTGLDVYRFSGDTLIYDRSGVLLADVGDQGNHRISVALSQVAPVMVKATVAIEDKNFYAEGGFDLESILRAAYSDLSSGTVVSGASTITQQLAKQLYLTPAQTLSRKIDEVVLAYELNARYTKDQIMQLYLNESPYGDQQYGVEAAAQTFFHTSAKNLDLAQAAMLAGLPQAPAALSPDVNFDAAKSRQAQVLAAMVKVGYITPEQAAQSYQESLKVYSPSNSFLAPHFTNYVLAQLSQMGFEVGVKQLKVTTTLDWNLQQIAQRVITSNLAKVAPIADPQGRLSSSLISIDPKTGEILAYVGSPDYNAVGGQYDYVSGVPRNLGSSVKPFMYGAAIAGRAATVDTVIPGGPSPLVVTMGNGAPPYSVTNYANMVYGPLPLRQSFMNSLNIPAVRTELAVGIPKVVDFMRSMGLDPLVPTGAGTYDSNAPDTQFGPSLTLGGYPMYLLQEDAALAAYADLGVYHTPSAILQVKDASGNVLYSTDPAASARQVVDPGVAYIMAETMSYNPNRSLVFGTSNALEIPGRTVAAKTGTSDDFKDGVTEGFTPDLATAVWMGDILGENHYMNAGQDGVFVIAPAWNAFMSQALAAIGEPGNDWYQAPPDVVKGTSTPNTYYLTGTTNIPSLPAVRAGVIS